jgi:hypothetical protein
LCIDAKKNEKPRHSKGTVRGMDIKNINSTTAEANYRVRTIKQEVKETAQSCRTNTYT